MQHEHFMRRCLDLAKQGLGYVAPNPLVGSVIVHKNKIIGEGYHEKYGSSHAEVNAIESVENKELLKEATIYVNLEPCAHFGKTPPCADLIVENNIPRAFIGCVDSYSEVAGKGIAKLKAAGCHVEIGILEKESLALNKRFFTFHNKKRPYVILKWAQSKDGFIDIDRSTQQKGTFWISTPESKQLVHQWRHEEAAILIGKNTLLNDNPELTVRKVQGVSPTRFVLDSKNEINLSDFKLGATPPESIKIIGEDCSNASTILNFLFNQSIQSVIIEGGYQTLKTFLESNHWDEARVIQGAKNIESGISAPKIAYPATKELQICTDTIHFYSND